MKMIINLLMAGEFIAQLQQSLGMKSGVAVKYSFQPLPSYWEMNVGQQLKNMR